jgi:hypothetical protein
VFDGKGIPARAGFWALQDLRYAVRKPQLAFTYCHSHGNGNKALAYRVNRSRLFWCPAVAGNVPAQLIHYHSFELHVLFFYCVHKRFDIHKNSVSLL